MHRTRVVDLVGDRRRQFTHRVVGELGHVHDRVDALEVGEGDAADVLEQGARLGVDIPVQLRFAVETSVNADHVVSGGVAGGRDHVPEVSLGAAYQGAHFGVLPSGPRQRTTHIRKVVRVEAPIAACASVKFAGSFGARWFVSLRSAYARAHYCCSSRHTRGRYTVASIANTSAGRGAGGPI